MEQATATATTETTPPETVEYGGLIWAKNNDKAAGVEYHATLPECGRFRVYQYPEGSYSQGDWLWHVSFDTLVDAAHKPSIMQMEASQIVGPDIKEAMQACLDAKGKFIADIKQLSVQLGIGNYPTGFMDGQAALVEKIKMVLP